MENESDIANTIGGIFEKFNNSSYGFFDRFSNDLKEPENFSEYNAKIDDTKKYIKKQKELFYKNTTLKEK